MPSKKNINPESLSKTAIPTIAVLLAVTFWAGSFSAMKVAVNSLGPWTVMWIRMGLAILVLAPFAKKLRPTCYRKGDWKPLTLLVALQPCLYFLFESYALRYTTSTQAGVISASVPLMVSVGAWLGMNENLNAKTMIGLIITMGGVAWLSLAGAPSIQASNPLLGNLLETAAMLAAAGYMLLVKVLSARYNTWTLTAIQSLAGFIFFIPGSPHAVSTLSEWPPILWLSLLYLGTFSSVGAFGLYNWGISRMPAGKASRYINLIPVLAVLFGWTLLGESLNSSQIMASACVFFGIWISQGKN